MIYELEVTLVGPQKDHDLLSIVRKRLGDDYAYCPFTLEHEKESRITVMDNDPLTRKFTLPIVKVK